MTAGFAARLEDEGRGLIGAAGAEGLTARLMGGMGIRLLLGDRYPAGLERTYGDLDVLVRKRDARGFERLATARGWQPAVEFNALNGARRMLFHDPESAAQIDVFVDTFEMCHRLPLADGLDRAGPLSLMASDLVMTKLQIVRLNAKDRNDLYVLLLGGATATQDCERVDPGRIAEVAAADWGTHHTFELNLARLDEQIGEAPLDAAAGTIVSSQIARIREAMEAAPKSRAWKLRAKIGERRQWYDEPEEVDRD